MLSLRIGIPVPDHRAGNPSVSPWRTRAYGQPGRRDRTGQEGLGSSRSRQKAAPASGLGVGYVLGGGAEYAISDRVSLKGEALYYNLGRMSVTANDNGSTHSTGGGSGPATATPYTASVDRGGVLISAGLNFKF